MKASDERYPVLLDLVVAGGSRQEVAKYFGVHVATARRWMEDPAFRADVHRVRTANREALADVQAARERASASALVALAELAADTSLPADVRLRAAMEVMRRTGGRGDV